MIYPSDMDKECIVLCDAINAVPGLHTDSSCCGHGKDSFRIWFYAEHIRSLYVVARHVDRRYGGHPDWRCIVDDNDNPETCVIFRLDSGSDRGESAYKNADRIASEMMFFLNNKEWMKMFGVE